MPNYVWKGRNRTGLVQEGVLVADTKEVALATLRRQNIVVTGIRERGKEISLTKMGFRVPAKILAVFTRQFSVMIDAGLPLVQCLEILANQQEHKNFAKILLQVRQDVEAGSTLADAMRRHPKAFDDLYVNMVAAGEAGGILDTILQRLSTYIEKAVKLRSQVRAALIYPIAVITIAGIVVAVILLKVIPTFAALFTSLGAELPFPTRVVIAASNFLARYFIFFVIGIGAAAVFFFRRYYQTYRGRRVIDGADAQGADHRHDPAQDRRGALLPDAGDPDVLGRADPREPRHHRAHRRQRDRRGRDPRDAQERRERQDPRRAPARTRRSSRTWSSR